MARSTVYWLVGQYADEGLLETVGPDTVRLGAKGFANEVGGRYNYDVETLLTSLHRI